MSMRAFSYSLVITLALPLIVWAQTTSFPVGDIVFEGNQSIATPALEALAAPYQNRRVTLADLKSLTDGVQALYRSRGYLLARAAVPAQRLEGGILRITVLEGRIGTTKVEGNRHYSTRFIERFFAPARRSGVFQEGPVTRALLILNEIPDLRVQSVLTRGAAPGTSDIKLVVQDRRPLHFTLDYNNYGNPLVGRNRAGATLTAGNLAFEGDQLDLRVAEPFPSESDPFYQATYSTLIGDRGARLGYQAVKAKTRVSGPLAVLDIRGDAEIHALTWSRPLSRTLSRATNFTAAFFAKTVENFVLGNTLVSRDDLRELAFGYSGMMADAKGRWYHSSTLTQGLGTAFGGNRNGDPQSSRAFSGNEFTKANTDWIRAQQLTVKDLMLFRAGAQWTSDSLTTAEQFGVGGPDSVRGFIQSEFLADRGYAVSAEYNRTLHQSQDWRLAGAAFVDHGEASLVRAAAGERASNHLTGAGGGVRAQYRSSTSLKLDLATPLSQDRNVIDHDLMLYANVSHRW